MITDPVLTAHQTIELADGRSLSFAAIGPPGGFPVLYMHGAIGSPLRRVPELQDAIEDLGIRYLMVDRPGFRGSDALPGRTVFDTASDVEELADRLGLGRFGVTGVSAGAPYALACAARMPTRVNVAVVSALSPQAPLHRGRSTQLRYRLPLKALVAAPTALTWIADRFAAVMKRWPALGVRVMELGACEADRQLLAEPEGRRALAESFLAAMSRGGSPMVEDYLVCCGDWGFEAGQVTGRVQLWHGMQDKLVPVESALRLASELPNAEIAVDLGEGHFFYKRRIADILRGVSGEPLPVEPGLARPSWPAIGLPSPALTQRAA